MDPNVPNGEDFVRSLDLWSSDVASTSQPHGERTWGENALTSDSSSPLFDLLLGKPNQKPGSKKAHVYSLCGSVSQGTEGGGGWR